MQTETLQQIKDILIPLGYEVESYEHQSIYLIPKLEGWVYIVFRDGLFELKLAVPQFSAEHVEHIIEDLKKTKETVKKLNQLLEVNGEKKESILHWQRKINKIGLGLNINGADKFWTFVESYGLHIQRNSSPECTELSIWNDDRITLTLFLDDEVEELRIHFGLYDENGDFVQDIDEQALNNGLQIIEGNANAFIFQLEEGLGLKVWIDKENPIYLKHDFIELFTT